MNYDNIIDEFLDGRLESDNEDELFDLLSSNDEMRATFKQQLAVKTAIVGDSRAFMPSPRSTVNIFSKLGMPLPAAASTLPKQSFLRKYGQVLYGATAATLATALLFIFLLNPYFLSKSNLIPVEIASIGSNTYIPPLNSSIENSNGDNINQLENNFEKSENLSSNQVKNRNDSHPKVAVYYRNKTKITGNQISPHKRDYIYLNDNYIWDPYITKASHYSVSNLKSNYLSDLLLRDIISPIPLSGQKNYNRFKSSYDISVETKQAEYFYLPYPDGLEQGYSLFNNLNITILYFFNENIAVGLDLRQEKFYQDFTGKTIYGSTLRYEQIPNIFSFGFGVRYYPVRYGDFAGYSQLSFGISKPGTIGRFMLGVEYQPYPILSLVLQGEYSILSFYHQNSSFTSNKFGVNYGIKFNF